jgi:hypothetical protein
MILQEEVWGMALEPEFWDLPMVILDIFESTAEIVESQKPSSCLN